MAIKYFQWPLNRPNGHKIYQHFPLQDPPKFTQIGMFWFENKPSGIPGTYHDCVERDDNFQATVAIFFSIKKLARAQRPKHILQTSPA
jgi:hypothetical protein